MLNPARIPSRLPLDGTSAPFCDVPLDHLSHNCLVTVPALLSIQTQYSAEHLRHNSRFSLSREVTFQGIYDLTLESLLLLAPSHLVTLFQIHVLLQGTMKEFLVRRGQETDSSVHLRCFIDWNDNECPVKCFSVHPIDP